VGADADESQRRGPVAATCRYPPAVPFDDHAEEEGSSGYSPPPHPDDRLWRHPSELRSHPIVPIVAPAGPDLVPTSPAPRHRRPWGAIVAAGTTGAVLAGAGVALFGVGERVVEREVVERVALNTVSPLVDGVPAVSARQKVTPAVVGIEGPGATGTGTEVVGSGVVVRDDGIVVTSAALSPAGGELSVSLPDGRTVAAAPVGSDPVTGLSVLDLEGVGYAASVLATGGALDEGESAYAVSAGPAGRTTTAGGVVGLTHRFVGPDGGALDGVVVAGPASPESLGGALVDERGVVIGVTTAVDGGSWYVAPIDVARKVTDDLLTDGRVEHCWLGVESSSDGTEGALVESVMPGSPADLGGLEVGDVVTEVDDRSVRRMPDLMVVMRARSPGDRVDVTVARPDGSSATLVLTLDARPAG
jgi:putative serine protease PepD